MIRNTLILLIAAACFLGCDTVVKLDVPRDHSQLVVNSFFHPDSTFGITLSKSQFVLNSGDFKKVSGATATLMDGEGNALATLQEQEPGIYISNVKPQPGKTYEINVSKSGFKTVTAQNHVPADSALMTKYEVERNANSFRSVRLSIWIDDSQNKDYYQLYGKHKITLYGEEIDTTTYEQELFFSSDDPVFGKEISGKRRLFFDDTLFDGRTYKMNLNTNVGSPQCSPMSDVCDQKTEVTLFIRKVSEAYFKYTEARSLQDDVSENPFAEPVPVYDNIENGLGIFAGFRVSKYQIKIPEN